MKAILLLSLFSLFLCHSISQVGINLIKRYEGCHLTAYQDSVGVWTIGYGTTSADKSITGTSIYRGLKISQSTADEWLRLSINKKYTLKVNKFDYIYHWTQNEFDALCSFAYNIGSIDELVSYGKLPKSSIPNVMRKYVYANKVRYKGLVDRRNSEAELFTRNGRYTPTPAPTPAPKPKPKPTSSPNQNQGLSLPLKIKEYGFHKCQDIIKMMEEEDMLVFLEEVLLA